MKIITKLIAGLVVWLGIFCSTINAQELNLDRSADYGVVSEIIDILASIFTPIDCDDIRRKYSHIQDWIDANKPNCPQHDLDKNAKCMKQWSHLREKVDRKCMRRSPI